MQLGFQVASGSKQLEKDLKPERERWVERTSGRKLEYLSGEETLRELNKSFQVPEELFYRECWPAVLHPYSVQNKRRCTKLQDEGFNLDIERVALIIVPEVSLLFGGFANRRTHVLAIGPSGGGRCLEVVIEAHRAPCSLPFPVSKTAAHPPRSARSVRAILRNKGKVAAPQHANFQPCLTRCQEKQAAWTWIPKPPALLNAVYGLHKSALS